MDRSELSCNMTDKSLPPSIYQKIHGQYYLCSRLFPNSLAWTPGTDLLCSAGVYVKGKLQSPLLSSCQGSTSSIVTPLSPVFVGAPSEKHNAALLVLVKVGVEGFRTIACQIATAPLVRVKILLQSQNEMMKSGRLCRPYKGVLDCFARTVRNEGILALWRGNLANIIGLINFRAISFTSKIYFVPLCNYKKEKDGYWKWYSGVFAAACLPPATAHYLVYPQFYAQTRLANDIKNAGKFGERQFKGIVDVYRKTLKSDGIAGLYRGCNISYVENLVQQGLFLVMTVAINPQLLLGLLGLQNSFLANVLLAGGFVTCAGLATYPMNTVRRRMMMTSGEAVKYKSSFDAFSKILKNEGIESLYKGARVEILRNVVLCAFIVAGSHLSGTPIPAKKKGSDGGGQPSSRVTISWSSGGG